MVDPVQPDLDERIVRNGKFEPEARKNILRHVAKIASDLDLDVVKTWIVGSSLTYQWTPQSDVDVTIFVNVDKNELKKLNRHIDETYNDMLFIGPHPVHFHCNTGKYLRFKADAIYDLDHDKWIKEPQSLNEHDIQNMIEHCSSLDEFNETLEAYLELKNLLASHADMQEIIKQAIRVSLLFEDVRDMRREEFNKKQDSNLPSANWRCSNIIFKLLENHGLGDLAEMVSESLSARFDH